MLRFQTGRLRDKYQYVIETPYIAHRNTPRLVQRFENKWEIATRNYFCIKQLEASVTIV